VVDNGIISSRLLADLPALVAKIIEEVEEGTRPSAGGSLQSPDRRPWGNPAARGALNCKGWPRAATLSDRLQNNEGAGIMAPDDIPAANPASEMEGKPKSGNPRSRSIGPESETRGGPEASDETLATRGRPGKASSGMAASDPSKPPGQPPEIPEPGPDKPPPIEEPPRPTPVPPNDPPPPIVASRAPARCGAIDLDHLTGAPSCKSSAVSLNSGIPASPK
jgi:hypothetical protein